MRTPPAALRARFSEHMVPVQLPSEASTAAPAAIDSAPAMASKAGPIRRGGGAGGGGGGAGGVSSSMWARSASASRNIVARASATVQTSQLFDSVAIGRAAGAAPSVENRRTTL